MISNRNFSAINTKTRVLKSRLLNYEDYISLMQMEGVKEQVLYLKNNTVYEKVLEDIDDLEDIQSVEIKLKRYLITQIKKVIKYFSDDYKELYKVLLLRYEIEDLKLYLRSVVRNDIPPRVACFFTENSTFNSNKLKNSINIRELIENLKGTIYYDVLNPYKDEEDSKIIFYMEMNLDRLYFNELSLKINKLSSDDKKALLKTLGENVDLLNIEWIYRGIKFYNLLPEELINFTLPHGLELKYKDIKKMCYSNEDELKDIVLNTRYSFLFDTEKDIDLYMERRIERYLYYKFKRVFKKGSPDVLITIAYIHILEYEIRDIISILEAKRYGLTLSETVDYLVKKIEGSGF